MSGLLNLQMNPYPKRGRDFSLQGSQIVTSRSVVLTPTALRKALDARDGRMNGWKRIIRIDRRRRAACSEYGQLHRYCQETKPP